MINARLITGVILGLIALCAIFIFPQWLFDAFIGIFILLGAWEFGTLMRCGILGKIIYLLVVVGCGVLALHHVHAVLSIAVVFWCVAFMCLLFPLKYTSFLKSHGVLFFVGIFLLVPCWIAGGMLHESGHRLLLFYVFMLTALSDTGAYYTGKAFGKVPLAPVLSPKKTQEGLLGGLIIALVSGLIIAHWVPQAQGFFNQFTLFLCGFLIILVGVLGDLFESLLKRQVDIKDSGNLLPGHGGVLDRIDSMCATLPIFMILMWVFKFL